MFGVTLETAIQRSQLAMDGIELPTVFRECIDYLEEYGMLIQIHVYSCVIVCSEPGCLSVCCGYVHVMYKVNI